VIPPSVQLLQLFAHAAHLWEPTSQFLASTHTKTYRLQKV
jgi:hypothetical protein